MIKLVFNVKRRPDVTPEEFHRYWLETHGPLVRQYTELFRLRRYIQTHLIDSPLNDQLAEPRGSAPAHFDGVAELWWDSEEDIVAALDNEAGLAAVTLLIEDESKFIDLPNSPLYMGVEHAIVGDL